MSLRDIAVTIDEFYKSIDTFVNKECEDNGDYLIHNNCSGKIRTGFLNLFYLNDDDNLDPGFDGFGIGPKKVPYCEICFPPDGFNYTYAIRFPILRERETNQPDGFEFVWGNREIVSGD